MPYENDPLLPWVRREGMALNTDLYQLTMVAGYIKSGIHEKRACFEYFFRELPPESGFAVFCGLEHVVSGIESMCFNDSDIEYLRNELGFDDEVIDRLEDFPPRIDLWAMPEGSLAFPNEPLLRTEGPLYMTQLVETFILNNLNYPTLAATKAARCVLAAEGDPVMEFGLRRAQGPDGGLCGARAAHIAGCDATSNVMAGKQFGIPVKGTHAHSWIMSFDSELESFRAYCRVFPDSAILLVDTYDTLGSGVPNAIEAFRELREKNPGVRAAVRLDSGDLARLSKAAYGQMVEAGFEDPLIVASGDLDEYLIADLKRQGAKINAWGVGTSLITAADYPALGGVYKLVAVEEEGWKPKLKIASNPAKTTDPGRKQVARLYGGDMTPLADLLYMIDEPDPEPGEITGVDRDRFHEETSLQAECVRPMLEKFMENGKRMADYPGLQAIRERCLEEIERLPEEMKRLRNPEVLPVLLSPQLAAIKQRLLKEESPKKKCMPPQGAKHD